MKKSMLLVYTEFMNKLCTNFQHFITISLKNLCKREFSFTISSVLFADFFRHFIHHFFIEGTPHSWYNRFSGVK